MPIEARLVNWCFECAHSRMQWICLAEQKGRDDETFMSMGATDSKKKLNNDEALEATNVVGSGTHFLAGDIASHNTSTAIR